MEPLSVGEFPNKESPEIVMLRRALVTKPSGASLPGNVESSTEVPGLTRRSKANMRIFWNPSKTERSIVDLQPISKCKIYFMLSAVLMV